MHPRFNLYIHLFDCLIISATFLEYKLSGGKEHPVHEYEIEPKIERKQTYGVSKGTNEQS